jgi:hypothetical protein
MKRKAATVSAAKPTMSMREMLYALWVARLDLKRALSTIKEKDELIAKLSSELAVARNAAIAIEGERANLCYPRYIESEKVSPFDTYTEGFLERLRNTAETCP